MTLWMVFILPWGEEIVGLQYSVFYWFNLFPCGVYEVELGYNVFIKELVLILNPPPTIPFLALSLPPRENFLVVIENIDF